MHIHPHLTIFIDGQQQVIPAGIGIGPLGDQPIHTHDASGKLHVESTVVYDFTLQNFFAIWGQPFDSQHLLSFHTNAAHPVAMTVNGFATTTYGDWILHDGDNIVLSLIEPPPPIPPSVLAGLFTHTVENYSQVVASTYQQFLGRTPDPSVLSFWVGQMQQGLTDERLGAFIVASSEYRTNHGGTATGWVQGMYHDLLGRTADGAGLSFWLGRSTAGANPADIAFGLALSAEHESTVIGAEYRAYLGRDADPAGLNYWLTAFTHGASNEDVVAGLIGSAEYFNASQRGQGNAGTWVRSVFHDVFHRAASDGEVSHWVGVIQGT